MKYLLLNLLYLINVSAFSQPIQKGHMIDYQIPKWVYKEVFEYNKLKPLVKLDKKPYYKPLINKKLINDLTLDNTANVKDDCLNLNIYPNKVHLKDT